MLFSVNSVFFLSLEAIESSKILHTLHACYEQMFHSCSDFFNALTILCSQLKRHTVGTKEMRTKEMLYLRLFCDKLIGRFVFREEFNQ